MEMDYSHFHKTYIPFKIIISNSLSVFTVVIAVVVAGLPIVTVTVL